jgi:hypothetical protein
MASLGRANVTRVACSSAPERHEVGHPTDYDM